MALVNCIIVPDNVTNVIPGSVNISSKELFITPVDGFFVSAADFTDNTFESFGDDVNGIILFDSGSGNKLKLENTTEAYRSDNKVKITVNFYSEFSINQETLLLIDVDGEAQSSLSAQVIIHLLEGVSANDFGSITVTPNTDIGVTHSSGSSSVPGSWYNGYTRHSFKLSSLHAVEVKIATIVFKSVQGENLNDNLLNVLQPLASDLLSLGQWGYGDWSAINDPGFRLVYASGVGPNDVSAVTSSGVKIIEKHFDLYYTPVGPSLTYPNPSLSEHPGDNYIMFSLVELAQFGLPPAAKKINRIETSLADLPNGSFNVIPPSGIGKKSPPIVKVYGNPGAIFQVTFRQSNVIAGGSISKSADPTVGGNFNGIVPDMPVGFVTIPSSGFFAFKLPPVPAKVALPADPSGWTEFEMTVEAGPMTAIFDSTVSVGGSIVKPGLINSSVTNIFYQYPNVNIEFTTTITGLGAYSGGFNNVFGFGGLGLSKFGVANKPPTIDPNKPLLSANTRRFEIRLFKSGDFVISNQPVASMFIPGILNNKDVVSFSNLRVKIGNGLKDTDTDYATITGSINCASFGRQDQEYTIDLTEVLTHS